MSRFVLSLVTIGLIAGCTADNPDYIPPVAFLADGTTPPPGDLTVLPPGPDFGPTPRDLWMPDLWMPDLAVNAGPSSDAAESVLVTWDVGESQTDNVEACAPMKRGLVSLVADAAHLQVGMQSARIDYGPSGSFYFQALYPKSKDAKWDLRGRTGIDFWLDAQQPVSYGGWAPPGPTVILCNGPGNHRRLDPAQNQTPRNAGSWKEWQIPLAGGGGWNAVDTGRFDPSNVNWIEFHTDPQKNAGVGTCQVWLDGVKFY